MSDQSEDRAAGYESCWPDLAAYVRQMANAKDKPSVEDLLAEVYLLRGRVQSWEAEAQTYAKNAEFWRDKFEDMQSKMNEVSDDARESRIYDLWSLVIAARDWRLRMDDGRAKKAILEALEVLDGAQLIQTAEEQSKSVKAELAAIREKYGWFPEGDASVRKSADVD